MTATFRIAAMAGDGIGPEVTEAALAVLDAVQARYQSLSFEVTDAPAGAGHYLETGTSLPESTLRTADEADAVLLAAMGLPDVRLPDGTEISPQIELRQEFGLYAGVRPIRFLEGMQSPLADPRAQDLDFIILRESTEGLFHAFGNVEMDGDRAARDTMQITRETSEKLFRFAFDLAAKRKAAGGQGAVTCVDKANVLGSLAFFRKVFDEEAARRPDLEARRAYVDAAALMMVNRPWEFDVIVTENMFGDILSDLGAALIGGLGAAPSADIGDSHAVFQPCHGTAPDIAGQGRANPTAMILSLAMMLDWLGEKFGEDDCRAAAAAVEQAVSAGYAQGTIRPPETGGDTGTAEIARAVVEGLRSA